MHGEYRTFPGSPLPQRRIHVEPYPFHAVDPQYDCIFAGHPLEIPRVQYYIRSQGPFVRPGSPGRMDAVSSGPYRHSSRRRLRRADAILFYASETNRVSGRGDAGSRSRNSRCRPVVFRTAKCALRTCRDAHCLSSDTGAVETNIGRLACRNRPHNGQLIGRHDRG